MKIHLIGGQSQSGKTTAVNEARKMLEMRGTKVSVIKDDQVDFIFDYNAPVQKNSLIAGKITGGCSCCNFTQLDSRITSLRQKSDPEVIFAEYSGTCNNLSESLVKPLLASGRSEIEVANFSTFMIAGVMLDYLKGIFTDISPEERYLIQRHLHEAEILVVTKTDLLNADEEEELTLLLNKSCPSKKIIFLDSGNPDSVKGWIEIIGKYRTRYGEGIEQTPSFLLDEEIRITTANNNAGEKAFEFMQRLSNEIVRQNAGIDYLKFLMTTDRQSTKFNYTELTNGDERQKLKSGGSKRADILVSGKIKSKEEKIRKIFKETLLLWKRESDVIVEEKFLSHTVSSDQ